MFVTNLYSIVLNAIKQKSIIKSNKHEFVIYFNFFSRSFLINSNDENKLHIYFASKLNEIDTFLIIIDNDTNYL